MTRPLPRLLIGLLLLVSVVSTQVGCQYNEATGRRQFVALLSAERANALGEEAKLQFRDSYGGDVPSPIIIRHVDELGRELAAIAEAEMTDPPRYDWEFFVVDSEVINAFALPGGKVFMSRGLLQEMTSDAQLAAVMGHEVGHVMAEHTRERMSQSMLVQVGAVALIGAGALTDNDWLSVLGAGTQVGGGLYLLKFNRDQEAESDRLGMRYMTKLGYDPRGMIQLMQILKKAGGGGQPEIFATHPNPDLRIEQAQRIIEEEGWDRRTDWRQGTAEFERFVQVPLRSLPRPDHRAQQQ